ncbi:type I restriction enzyme specificity HsdS domain protein [Mycoplasma haemocanis str. Illinois]|uniref:Type I restriction enzyme specificity HsdS domain protein n=1 Tax=Mycoplasma haemocanis (strain Illinois) TaxID=1111676 RepID=H6N6Y7_MYCHN|nr:restriction endonuclease subunit S [Mycoplasma haemocanis]AEW45409.1 type I restriction enzyme specificity HsdS domain protein [Mycoplasma haemocanis str. Illinois]
MSFKQLLLEDKDLKFFKLGDVCSVYTGVDFKSHFYRDSGFPIIKVRNIQDGQIITDSLNYCDPDNHPDAMFIKYGDVVMARAGSSGKIGINLLDQEFFFDGNLFKFVPQEDVLMRRYLYHFLLSQQEKIQSLVKGSTIPVIRKSALEKLRIPVPSLRVQERIAQTLDKFQELRQELLLRKKQHGYYRNQIWEPLLGNLTE